jgi:hypothetical protein
MLTRGIAVTQEDCKMLGKGLETAFTEAILTLTDGEIPWFKS